MKGAPAKPMSGVAPSSAVSSRTDSVMSATSSGVRSRSWARSARERIGCATTGPTPATMSRSTPMADSGTTMSEKKIAASTPWRRTGCRVISVTRSGRRHDSSIPTPSRTLRYSGSDRPAWRMNHTGVCGTSRRRAARTRAESAVARRTASPGVVVRALGVAAGGLAGVVTTRHPPTPAGAGTDSASRVYRAVTAAPPTARATPTCCTRLSRSSSRTRAQMIVTTG